MTQPSGPPPAAEDPETPARRVPESLQSLAHSRYRVFAVGALLSGIGGWAIRLTQLLMMLQATDGNGAAAGVLAACQYLPLLVLGGPIGAFADRHTKSGVLRAGQALMAATALVEGGLVALGHVGVVSGMLLALLFGLGGAADNTMRMALAPELVPTRDIGNAVSLNAVSMQIGRLVGPAVAGVVIGVYGFTAAYVFGAAGCLAFVVILTRLRSTDDGRHERSDDSSLRAGLAYVRQRPDMVLVFFVIGVGGLIGPNLATMATIIVQVSFEGTAAQAGLVTSVLAVGTLFGAIWTTRRPWARLDTVVRAAALLGIAAAVCALAGSTAVLAVLLFPAGFLALLMVTQSMSLVQMAVDPEFRGRVTSLFAMVLIAGVPIGSPVYGVLTDWLGPRAALAVMGLFLFAAAMGAELARRRLPVAPALPTDRP